MDSAFVPPSPDQWEGPARQASGFTPPPVDSWQGEAQKKAAPESRGFLGELWNEVKNGPANLLQVGNSINQAVTHPIDTFNAMGQQIEGTARKAKEAFKSGDYKKAAREGLNTAINAAVPGLGTSSSEAGEMYDRGDYAGGAGKTLGIGFNTVAGIKTPQLAKGAAEAITPGVSGPVSRAFRVDPRVAVTRALRPVPSDPDFPQRVPQTVKAIKDANGGEAPAGITSGKLDIVGAANKAIEQHQGVLDKWLARAKGVRVNGDELVIATRAAIPDMMWERDPAGARALIADAQLAFGGKTYTVDQFRQFLKSENGDLSAFYRKAPGLQADAAVAGTPTAIQEAQTQSIRDVLYKALDPEGSGSGPRTIQQKTGDLYKMRDAALRRNNAIVAEQPLSPIDRVIDPIRAHLPQFLSSNAAATGLSFSDGQVGRSLPILKRAFKAVGNEPSNVLPEPGEPLYPTGDTRRLLGQGGFTGGAPGMNDAQVGASVPGMHPSRGLPATDPSATRSARGSYPVPQGDPSVLDPKMTQRVIDLQRRGSGSHADADWWQQQPPTRPEIQARYEQLFNRAENLSPQRPVQVPETGIPEGVARGSDARQNIARQVLNGKTWDQATAAERNAIDQLVTEGYGSALPHYAKGGIAGLDGPEVAMVGEEGPEAIVPLTAEHPTVPEAPGTIAEQVHQLTSGKRRIVMLPKGTPIISTFADKTGNQYLFNPQSISRNDIHAAIKTNNLPKILGAKQGGMGAPDKTRLRGSVKAVVGKTPGGITTQATATDRMHLGSAIRQTRKLTPKGGSVRVTSPDAAVRERIASPAPMR